MKIKSEYVANWITGCCLVCWRYYHCSVIRHGLLISENSQHFMPLSHPSLSLRKVYLFSPKFFIFSHPLEESRVCLEILKHTAESGIWVKRKRLEGWGKNVMESIFQVLFCFEQWVQQGYSFRGHVIYLIRSLVDGGEMEKHGSWMQRRIWRMKSETL